MHLVWLPSNQSGHKEDAEEEKDAAVKPVADMVTVVFVFVRNSCFCLEAAALKALLGKSCANRGLIRLLLHKCN